MLTQVHGLMRPDGLAFVLLVRWLEKWIFGFVRTRDSIKSPSHIIVNKITYITFSWDLNGRNVLNYSWTMYSVHHIMVVCIHVQAIRLSVWKNNHQHVSYPYHQLTLLEPYPKKSQGIFVYFWMRFCCGIEAPSCSRRAVLRGHIRDLGHLLVRKGPPRHWGTAPSTLL